MPLPDPDGAEFAADYSAARASFLSAAAAAALCESLPVDGRGPGGEALAIDIAWLGAAQPARAVLVHSGVHGVVTLFADARTPASGADGAPVVPGVRVVAAEQAR